MRTEAAQCSQCSRRGQMPPPRNTSPLPRPVPHPSLLTCRLLPLQFPLSAAQVNADSKFVDLGADSLDTVEIMMALEEKFDIQLDEEGAEKISTVQVRGLGGRLSGASGGVGWAGLGLWECWTRQFWTVWGGFPIGPGWRLVGKEGGPGLRLPAWAARLIGVRRFCVPTLPALLSVPRPSSLRAGGG